MQANYRDHKYTVGQWDVIDIPFTAVKEPASPFSVTFGGVFTGPDGATMTVPGFYDGQCNFVIRFAPPAVGRWSFITYASLPSLVNYQGTITCQAQTDATRHGPIVLHPEKQQRFAYADGTPYFLMAFECDWLFALDAGNVDGLPKTLQLVESIALHGFNHVVMNVFAYDVSWKKDPNVRSEHEYGASAAYPFGGSNDDPDFSELNVAYFQHLDRVVRLLDEKGVAAHLMIYVWNKLVQWPDMYSEMDNTFFDYVITRYQAFPNIVWDISKEALGYGRCDMDYVIERLQRVRRLDAYQRLVTVHDYSFCRQYPELVDFISIQTWCTDLYRKMLDVVVQHPDKPVFNIEHGGYEQGPYVVFTGDYIDARTCLERNYACIFAGSYSTYYWQCTSWNVIVHDFQNLEERQRPKLSYYHHAVELFSRYDFSQMTPLETRHSSGLELSNGTDTYLFLIPKENYAIHLALPATLGEQVMVTWFNPFTGEYVVSGLEQARTWHECISPWVGQMAVLILERG
ncbi:MAG: DUF5060 domain-containing protein [Anaerolineae bacterium]|nr:DUF5060 domain-containing protein [Anaerolineae bacterium]